GGRDRLGAAPGHPERRPWERRRAVWAQLRQAAGGGADTGSDPAGAVRLTAQSHRRRYRRPRRRHDLLRRLGNSPPRSPLAPRRGPRWQVPPAHPRPQQRRNGFTLRSTPATVRRRSRIAARVPDVSSPARCYNASMTRGLEARGRAAVGCDEAHGAQDRGGLPALRDRLRGGPDLAAGVTRLAVLHESLTKATRT